MKYLSFLFSLILLASCSTEKNKALVLYYSQTGTTQAVAEEIQRLTGADIVKFDAVEAYNGSYAETIQRCQEEMKNGIVPAINPIDVDLAQYDVVYLGCPIWFGTCALPMMGLLAEYDFSGKKIVPFCTFGSGGLETAVADIRKYEPNAEVAEGYGVRTARVGAAPDEIYRFLVLNGYIDGQVEAYADYSEQAPVTEEEAAIFDAACSSYQFPLGTPVTVGKRTTPQGTDYRFVATSQNMDGSASESVVLVTVQADKAPEFTRVIRN